MSKYKHGLLDCTVDERRVTVRADFNTGDDAKKFHSDLMSWLKWELYDKPEAPPCPATELLNDSSDKTGKKL